MEKFKTTELLIDTNTVYRLKEDGTNEFTLRIDFFRAMRTVHRLTSEIFIRIILIPAYLGFLSKCHFMFRLT